MSDGFTPDDGFTADDGFVESAPVVPQKAKASATKWSNQLGSAFPGFLRAVAAGQAVADPVADAVQDAHRWAFAPYSPKGDRVDAWGPSFGDRYQQHLRALQAEDQATRDDAPWKSGLLRGVGAIPLMAATGGQSASVEAPAALTFLQRAGAAMPAGAGYGAMYGAGEAPADAGVGTVAAHTVGGGLAGGAAAGLVGGLMPAHNPGAQAGAQLKAATEKSAELERKAAERGLQALTGTKHTARRAARALAQDNVNRPTEVGNSVWQEGGAANGYRTSDELADALTAAEKDAGQQVGSLYAAHTSPAVPKADVLPAIEGPATGLASAASTEKASADSLSFLRRAIDLARKLSVRRELAQDPHAPGLPGQPLSPSDLHALRMDIDTQARGWAGSQKPSEQAGSSVLNQARGLLNQKLLLPAMDEAGAGDAARAADARFGRLTDAAFLAEKARAGDLFGEEGGLAQLERILAPAGSLLPRTAASLGHAAESAAGAASAFQKATVNNPRWNQFVGRRAYSGLQRVNATPIGSASTRPGLPPTTAAAEVPADLQAFIAWLKSGGVPGSTVPAAQPGQGQK